MSERAPAWVVPVMRVGYIGRSLVYVLVGGLAFAAAWQGGSAEGTSTALSTLRDQSWGVAALWVIAIGLFCYGIWRMLDSYMDLESHGTDLKGVVARTGLVVTGLIHIALGVYAVRLASGDSSGSGGGSGGSGKQQEWTAWLLQQDYGSLIVMALGLVTIGAGIYYGYKGYAEKYKEHITRTRTSERLSPVCKFGIMAHGVAIVMIGSFLFWAGYTSDASEAGGLGKAFETVREATFGQLLLGLLALGLLSFAVYCVIEAVYRIVPARAGSDISSLASRAKSQAESAGRQAAASVS